MAPLNDQGFGSFRLRHRLKLIGLRDFSLYLLNHPLGIFFDSLQLVLMLLLPPLQLLSPLGILLINGSLRVSLLLLKPLLVLLLSGPQFHRVSGSNLINFGLELSLLLLASLLRFKNGSSYLFGLELQLPLCFVSLGESLDLNLLRRVDSRSHLEVFGGQLHFVCLSKVVHSLLVLAL